MQAAKDETNRYSLYNPCSNGTGVNSSTLTTIKDFKSIRIRLQ
jgi:hypothetical protein